MQFENGPVFQQRSRPWRSGARGRHSRRPMTTTTVRVPAQPDPPLRGAPDLLSLPRTGAFTHDVALVGLGYVGLPTALAFHAAGKSVIGLDVNESRLEAIRSLRADLLPDDRRRLRGALVDEAFVLTGDAEQLRNARTVIIAVPTPVDRHHLPDLDILRSACAAVVDVAMPGQTLIL